MKRSSSASIVSDKPFPNYSSSASQSVVFRSSSVSSGLDTSDLYLPKHNPFSLAAEKERRRLQLAKIFVHFIPVVIVFCAIVLWLFSYPESVLHIWEATAKRIKHEQENKVHHSKGGMKRFCCNVGQLSSGGIQ